MGTFMLIVGIVGAITCILLLFLLPGIFARQKKKLYEQIEEEE